MRPDRALLPRAGLATLLAAAIALPALAQEQPAEAAPEDAAAAEVAQATAAMINREGEQVGSATLTDVPAGGVLIDIQVDGLPPEQWLGFHIHEVGECNPDDNFDSAGGHYNPAGAEHGFYAAGGLHAGDMPNQWVDAAGILQAQVFNHMVALDEGDAAIRGRALMIHEQADDYESQPTGEAGGRLACGVIE